MILRKKLLSFLILASCVVGINSAIADEKLNEIITDEGISDAWCAQKKSHPRVIDDYYEVTAYPKAEGKTEKNYFSDRDAKPFDSVVLSRYPKGELGRILESEVEGHKGWIQKGLSTHYFIPQSTEVVVNWGDPSEYKAQMAGQWNARSVEMLVETDAAQNVSQWQIDAIVDLKTYLNKDGYNIGLKYLGDHSEARHSGKEGQITNIDAIRTATGLAKLPE